MKTLIIWAAKHRKKAVAVMVLLHTVLIILGIYTGRMLIDANIELNKIFILFPVSLFLIAFFLYPVKNKKSGFSKYDLNTKIFKYSYKRHKMLDMMSSVAAFMMVLYAGNLYYSNTSFYFFENNKLSAADYIHKNKNEVAVKKFTFRKNKKRN